MPHLQGSTAVVYKQMTKSHISAPSIDGFNISLRYIKTRLRQYSFVLPISIFKYDTREKDKENGKTGTRESRPSVIFVVTRENRSFYICPDGESWRVRIVSQYRLDRRGQGIKMIEKTQQRSQWFFAFASLIERITTRIQQVNSRSPNQGFTYAKCRRDSAEHGDKVMHVTRREVDAIEDRGGDDGGLHGLEAK
jgi:hypothetical protein